jgi:hypothetical protein
LLQVSLFNLIRTKIASSSSDHWRFDEFNDFSGRDYERQLLYSRVVNLDDARYTPVVEAV